MLHIPWFFLSNITKEEAGVLACGHVRIFARTWTLGAFLIKSVVSPALIRPNTLGSVRRREFWHYMHQLRIMSLVKCWVARLLSSATLRSALSAKVAPGELLRLCPSSAGRAPQERKPKTDCHDIARDWSTTRPTIGMFRIPPL